MKETIPHDTDSISRNLYNGFHTMKPPTIRSADAHWRCSTNNKLTKTQIIDRAELQSIQLYSALFNSYSRTAITAR